MRRIGFAVVALGLAAGVAPAAATTGVTASVGAVASAHSGSAPRGARQPAAHEPRTLPALQKWTAGHGRWQLGPATRIVVGRHERGLNGEARLLSRDLAQVIHRRLPVVIHSAVRRGDIVLRRSRARQDDRSAYRLDVHRLVRISASRPLGIFYGGRTLIQLLAQHRWIHRGDAHDWSRYSQRGLMVDCSRTAYPTGWIVREIRELALLKMNVLHLHLTDDQRWGIASHAFHGIVAPDAFSYAAIHRILRVAHRYHVRVIPEIDMPGHMATFLAQHPSLELKPLLVGGSDQPQQYVTDKLDITKPVVRRDVKRMLLEYLRLFPGRYFDMGDDEVLVPAEVAVFPQLETYAIAKYGVGATASDTIHGFINWVDRVVRRHGKTLRVWNDQLGGSGLVPVRHDVVVDWWTEISPLGDTVSIAPSTLIDQGFKVLNAGWFPNYYTGDLGPVSGKADPAQVYRDWAVNQFDGEELKNGTITTTQLVPANSPRLLGDAMSIWGPLPETPHQTAAGIAPRLAVVAQKTWGSPPPTASYAGFARLANRVGVA